MGYYPAARNAMTGKFAGLTFLEIDPKTTTTGEVGFSSFRNTRHEDMEKRSS